MNNIRNFCIIAHIDHGKSTLADRLLELTGSIEKRKMQSQVLDTMDLEREHGITIKLQPARMNWSSQTSNLKPQNDNVKLKINNTSAFQLNLIDTPGHVDFGYEVSRSLAAVEGALLVVDASQGVQAQTLANLHLAQKHNLVIIPVINKIDLPVADPDEVIKELDVLNINFACEPILVSAKTGQNVEAVLEAIVKHIPAPTGDSEALARALIFDSKFDPYRGVITYVRMVDGCIKKGESIKMMQTETQTQAIEVGAVCVGLQPSESIITGQIGYIVTTLKDVSGARVGDTITNLKSQISKSKISDQNLKFKIKNSKLVPLAGYREPQPMVYAGLFTTGGEDFEKLRDALGKLKLNDASLQYEPATSKAFGFGFRAGFLGLLHLEIIKERLEREYNLDLVVTTPTVAYRKSQTSNLPTSPRLRGAGKPQNNGGPSAQSDYNSTVNGQLLNVNSSQLCWEEPWVKAEIITNQDTLGGVMQLVTSKRGILGDVDYLGDRVVLTCEIPLGEIIIDFYDRLKAVTSGYGSLSYDVIGYRPADLVQMDVMVAEDIVDALSRLVPRSQVQGVARRMVEKLKELVPRQNFEVKLQVAVGGKIIAAEKLSAFRKDVTAKLYGGDVTRKRKLLEKQKKGKKKMATMGNVEVPTSVFVKLLKY